MTNNAEDILRSDDTLRPTADSRATVSAPTVELSALPDPCTSADLATVLGKSPRTLVDWCQQRDFTQIPCFRLGNRWCHRVPELVRWINGIKSGRIEFRRKARDSTQRR